MWNKSYSDNHFNVLAPSKINCGPPEYSQQARNRPWGRLIVFDSTSEARRIITVAAGIKSSEHVSSLNLQPRGNPLTIHRSFQVLCSTRSTDKSPQISWYGGIGSLRPLARLLFTRVKRNSALSVRSYARPPNQGYISPQYKPPMKQRILCGEGNGPLIRLGIFAKKNPTPI